MGLQRLRDHRGWDVAAGSTDIRGWRLHDAGGRKVGVIVDLLFEPATGEAREAVADLWSRRVRVPVADLVPAGGERRVVAHGYDEARLAALPAYEPAAHDGAAEEAPRRERVVGEGPETIRLLAERLEVAKRRTRVGEVSITKRPVVDWIEEALDLDHEELEIHHEPVDRPATGQERIETDGDTIRIPVLGEKVVVERIPVVKEIITIRKKASTERVTIREAVRHEEVTFEGLPPGADQGPRP